jgi:hypothetical protein
MRSIALSVALVASALSFAGCTSSQEGPIRPITIADDVANAKLFADAALSDFYAGPMAHRAEVRNEIITARMFIADMEYHYYEARLTKEVQEEGLGATLTSLGLTTAATLLPAASTKAILAGAATAVTGADKAYSEKELLSNTIQALQTQMRADRKTQAAVIYAKMLRDNGKTITPIIEYTLPMALSDAETYYQAGTIASALIGLSKTLANAEQNADEAKSQAGPNPGAVSDAKGTAAPISESAVRGTPVIHAAQAPLPPIQRNPVIVSPTRLNAFEQQLTEQQIDSFQQAVCLTPTHDLGALGSPTRTKIKAALNASDELLTDRKAIRLRRILRAGPTCSPS